MNPSAPNIWQTYRIPMGQAGHWQIGALHLWVQRLPDEWRVAHEIIGDFHELTTRIEVPTPSIDLLGKKDVTRFGHSGDDEELVLSPALADRSVVGRPERTFIIPAGEEITIYVSTPLWLRAELRRGNSFLFEMPVSQPSDTWFGPSTREGELCYATRTFCRLHLEDLHFLPHRAVTAMLVRNSATTPLELQRLNLPVTNLALYRGPDGNLWTEDVVFERSDDNDYAAVRFRQRVERSQTAIQIAPPRNRPSENVVLRAFGSLFRGD